ncbi:MAG: ISNCY family transposase, partial [Candidatus Dadabacteria bacterium]|nr:ISNCY family transposase [Candidatus Dadabacteria bacterium]
MRKIKNLQLELAGTPIEKIRFNPKSRDDIPAILIGLQHIYTNPETREKLFSLLEEKFLPEVDLRTGRPGMDIWRVVVLGVMKQGLDCDYDRLHHLANNDMLLRQMLGHSGYSDNYEYGLQTIIDNVSLL